MKHLKLFKESFGDEPTWEIISYSDYMRNREIKVDWYPNEISEVRTTLKSIDDVLDFYIRSGSGEIMEIDIRDYTKGSGNLKFILELFKTDDEYFYVKENFFEFTKGEKYEVWKPIQYKPLRGNEKVWLSFYRCDQLEGFIKFLLDRHKYIMEI